MNFKKSGTIFKFVSDRIYKRAMIAHGSYFFSLFGSLKKFFNVVLK